MNLIIDQGNTGTKYATVDEKGDIILKKSTVELEGGILQEFLAENPGGHVLISSVKKEYAEIKALPENTNAIVFFDDNCRLPLTNLYATPKTLGKDRLAGVCGAMVLFPGENCLVIDAGTCITYDFIDAEKNYHGGSISPGLTMRFKAMHEFTGKLPLAAPEWPVDFTGNTTLTGLQTGVAFGMAGEINSFISLYKGRWNGLKVLMCGGDTEFLAKRCESEIFAAPDLVISGLNEILKYNLPHVA